MNSIYNFSNPKIVYEKAKQYLGNNVSIKLSNKPVKKYMVLNPHTNKWVYFGQMGYEDFTKHQDLKRRKIIYDEQKIWGVIGEIINIRQIIYHAIFYGNNKIIV